MTISLVDALESVIAIVAGLGLVGLVVWVVGGSGVGLAQLMRDRRADGLPAVDRGAVAFVVLTAVVLLAGGLVAAAVGGDHPLRAAGLALGVVFAGMLAVGELGRSR